MQVQELARLRMFGAGVTEAEVLASRGDARSPLPLPPIELLAPYSVATAEREAPGGPLTVRLWMHVGDATAYLERRERAGELTDAGLFRVLPTQLRV